MSKYSSTFRIAEKLHECQGTLIIRAHEQPSGKSVVVKIIKPEAARSAAARLRHEFSVLSKLDLPGITRAYRLEGDEHQPMMVMEDIGGRSLDQLFASEPVPVEQFLNLAIKLADILAGLHRHRIIHKNINPSNIVFNPATRELRLIDFGISDELPRRAVALQSARIYEGTLEYLSPEQTGRMNRAVDYRADFYSLGVTFYRLLTGKLPFDARDALGIFHLHIAGTPVSPEILNPKIPKTVSKIVLKLMAKMAEDRYQSARGLEADLRKCLCGLTGEGIVQDFDLGLDDFSDRVSPPEKLYGREEELNRLLLAFEKVSNGERELLLVAGYAGVGKSRLVREIHKTVFGKHGYLIEGKFEQLQRNVPYFAWIKAFEEFIYYLLMENEEKLAQWKQRILKALGNMGRCLTDLIPNLELVIGAQPDVTSLEPVEAQNRFNFLFLELVKTFATKEHPLVVFLNDMQWIDEASLKLLHTLMTGNAVTHVLVIGAYRDNEVDAFHLLTTGIEALRKQKANIELLTVRELSEKTVNELIADILNDLPARTNALTYLIYSKTGGNPFFILQTFKSLVEKGAISLDARSHSWQWDIALIEKMEITDNVVALMVTKIRQLTSKTQHLLSLAACIGFRFRVSHLSIIAKQSEDEIREGLQPAMREGLIVAGIQQYQFAHDRVQQAAYTVIPVEERPAKHLSIGRLLLENTLDGELGENIFDIVDHLNRGMALITLPAEREHLAELNLIAGKRAKASAAYVSALAYLASGNALLAGDCWKRQHELAFALDLNLAECELSIGEHARSEERLDVLSRRAADIPERAAVVCLQIDLYAALDRNNRAVAVSLEFLKNWGIEWSLHPTREDARLEYERVLSNLGNRTIEDLVDLPLMSDQVSHAVMTVLSKTEVPAMFTDKNLVCLVISRAVRLSIEYGNSDAACYAYIIFGLIAGLFFADFRAGSRFAELARVLVEQRGLKRYQWRVHLASVNMARWMRHVRADVDLLRKAFDATRRTGDLIFAGYCNNLLVTSLLEAGDPLERVQREAESGFALMQSKGFGPGSDIVASRLLLIRGLRGLTREFGSFEDEPELLLNLSNKPKLILAECFYWIAKLQACFIAGNYSMAVEAAEKAKPLIWASSMFFEVANYCFYDGLARAARCDFASPSQRQQHLEAITADQRQLKIWAENCPENFENRSALVAAEIARIEQRDQEAMRLYEQAIESSRRNGFVNNEAIAYEVAASFYRQRGFQKIAGTYLAEAAACYSRWGADGKLRQLERDHPWLVHAKQQDITTLTDRLDVVSVAKAQQAISGEILSDRLAQTLLRIVMENAGAGHGYLYVENGGELQAEMKPGDSGAEQLVFNYLPADGKRPTAILNYVRHSRVTVILPSSDADWDRFQNDEYMLEAKPKSVLCMPIQRKDTLLGVLYLENNLVTGAFTLERRTVLETLASQAAISLEMAGMYEALKKSELSYRRIISTANEGILVLGPDQRITFVNAKMAEIVGYSPEEMLGRLVTDFMFEDDFFDHEQKIERRRQGISDHYERKFRCKDGQVVWSSVSAAPINDQGQFFGSFAMFTDITESKRAQEKLRESERRSALLIQNAPIGIVIHSPDGRVVRSNATAAELFGLSAHQMLGLGMDDPTWHFIRENGTDMPKEEYPVAQVLASMRPLRNAVVGATKPGASKIVWMLVDAVPSLEADGRLAEVIAIFMDITDRKRFEEELKESAHRKDDFIAMLGHELRNPLSPIRNASHILKMLRSPDPRVEKTREIIDRQTTHISNIVDDLLDVSRIARGKITVQMKPVDFVQTVRAAADDFRPELEARELNLNMQLPKESVWVLGDFTRLSQVVSNIFLNAIKFSERFGRICVKLSAPTTENELVTLCVEDTGIGMTKQTLERLFIPFEQASTDIARSRGGLGLGLALTKGLVNLHGGTVEASSEGLGKGTRIVVRLPAYLKSQPRQALASIASKSERLSILIVEDNIDAAESLRLLLEFMGHTTEVASDGAAALEATRIFRPEVIICDIGLPGSISGYDVARAVRADPSTHPTRLLALTGYGQKKDKQLAKDAGFDAHMTKPADPAAIEQFLLRR